MFNTLYYWLGYDIEEDEDVECCPEKDKTKRQKYLVCKQIEQGDTPRLRSVYLRQVKPLKRDDNVIMGIPVNRGKKKFFKRHNDKPFYTIGLANHLNEIL
tara:strand:- start:766 stop:1065 length:300 start_codon:yes stop_codon:yes gene_type:complete